MTILLRFLQGADAGADGAGAGVSQVQVSRWQRRALQKLRTAMETEG